MRRPRMRQTFATKQQEKEKEKEQEQYFTLPNDIIYKS
jgi:hypothetical protein